MDALRAVAHTLARHDASKTLLHAIKDRSPDAAARGTANHDASVHTNCTKVACQIGPEEGGGILLNKHGIAFMRGYILINLDQRIIFGPGTKTRDLLREDAAVRGMFIVHLHLSPAPFLKDTRKEV